MDCCKDAEKNRQRAFAQTRTSDVQEQHDSLPRTLWETHDVSEARRWLLEAQEPSGHACCKVNGGVVEQNYAGR